MTSCRTLAARMKGTGNVGSNEINSRNIIAKYIYIYIYLSFELTPSLEFSPLRREFFNKEKLKDLVF